jgi:fatty acid-binding protein DegV
MNGEKIYEEIISYMKHTHLYYSLASVHNLARNGRVNPILAKGLGILGIRIVATASPEGTIQTLDKCRGEKKAIKRFIEHMEEKGYTNGKIVIAHNMNESGALELRDRIIEKFGSFNGYIHKTTGLCSYYAEPESILIGFEA